MCVCVCGNLTDFLGQSVSAIESTDCFSAQGLDTLPTTCVLVMTFNNLMVKLQPRSFGEC